MILDEEEETARTLAMQVGDWTVVSSTGSLSTMHQSHYCLLYVPSLNSSKQCLCFIMNPLKSFLICTVHIYHILLSKKNGTYVV